MRTYVALCTRAVMRTYVALCTLLGRWVGSVRGVVYAGSVVYALGDWGHARRCVRWQR
ncbi:MAG: hypothetical protein IPK82_00450 [Polyangiaceae bacterium]|nr:hypothetical protein [Polyangiaceae bacterium]